MLYTFFLIVFPIVAKIKIAKIKKDKTVYKFALNSEKRRSKIRPKSNKHSLKKIVIVLIVFEAVVAENMFRWIMAGFVFKWKL